PAPAIRRVAPDTAPPEREAVPLWPPAPPGRTRPRRPPPRRCRRTAAPPGRGRQGSCAGCATAGPPPVSVPEGGPGVPAGQPRAPPRQDGGWTRGGAWQNSIIARGAHDG